MPSPLIDQLEPAGVVFVIGHSMGTPLALDMAAHGYGAMLTAIGVPGVLPHRNAGAHE